MYQRYGLIEGPKVEFELTGRELGGLPRVFMHTYSPDIIQHAMNRIKGDCKVIDRTESGASQ